MFLRCLLSRVLLVLLPIALTSSIYLYLYPVFNGCAYPLPLEPGDSLQASAFLNTVRQHVSPQSAREPAIFRLLVLADPQLEGDSSLPLPEYEFGARIRKHWEDTVASLGTAPFPVHIDVLRTVWTAVQALVTEDVPRAWGAARKRLDLLGNDFYLAHIYRTLHWWTRPTHVTVLGDLLGSQWVTDEEFDRRGYRYWHRVFRGGERVSDEITYTGASDHDAASEPARTAAELEQLQPHASPWTHRIINIVGNHDVGYSGDASDARIERFERLFGRANWDVRFRHPAQGGEANQTVTPTLHLINLNSLTLDAPPFSQDIQARSYAYINDIISHRSYPVEDRTTFTLLLTHLPLHKREGICKDGPYFTFFDADDEDEPENPRFRAGGLREQNHLSEHVSSNGILQGIFGISGDEHAPTGGRGRNGLILTGHDHAGCDVVHYVDRTPQTPPVAADETDESNTSNETDANEKSSWVWNARRYNSPREPSHSSSTPSIREITLRSMMGEYGGNVGLLSLWFDFDAVEWKYAVSLCPAGVQHIWWAVHVVDILALVVLGIYIVLRVSSVVTKPRSLALEVDEKKTQ